MWNHPITSSQIEILKSWNYQIIAPVVKTLVCGDTGIGAMESIDNIVSVIVDIINRIDVKD